jgi:sodium transport system permease protein
MNFMITRTIYFKEMLDTFRDKRTMITMLGIPIILYPVLFIIMIQMAMLQESKLDEQVSKIALLGPVSEMVLTELKKTDQVEFQNYIESPEEALKNGDFDALVKFESDFDEQVNQDGSGKITILYDQTEPSSREAEGRLYKAFQGINETLLNQRLNDNNLPETFAVPLKVDDKNIATASKSSGTILGAILPLIMVVMLSLGAFYPAVDITAGEKERGTFETLLSTPATKLEIVTGKFLAVFTLSLLTGFLNLASMSITFYFQLPQLVNLKTAIPDGEQLVAISPISVVGIAIVIIPLAFFISAIMMSVSVLARSFKEAQNYVSPLFIFILLPVAATSFPGIELTATTQFIPLTNIALLFRDLITGDVQIQYFFTVFLCTCIYALMSLVLATWMFQREEVILSEDKGLPLTLDRRAFTPSDTPTAGTAMGIFAVVMLLLFYIAGYVQGQNVYTGLIITLYLLIALPVIVILKYVKVNLKTALNLKRFTPLAAVGVILASFSWVFINIQLGLWQNEVLPMPPDLTEAFGKIFKATNVPLLVLIFVMVVSPSICEELLFRGAITSGLRNLFSPKVTIIIVGILFGLFHLSIYRFALTGLTGIILTYYVVRSGSIYLAMIGHFINNFVAILFEKEIMPSSFIQYLEGINIEENGFPLHIMAASIVAFIIGIVIFEKSLTKPKTDI